MSRQGDGRNVETRTERYRTLVDEGFEPFVRELGSNLRRWFIERLPPEVLYYWFEARSRSIPSVSDANPLRLVWVDPDRIAYYDRRMTYSFGQVLDGTWDEHTGVFEDELVYWSIERRYVGGVAWEDTELYREYYSRLRNDGPPLYARKFDNVSELDAYVEAIDDLYERISTEGYKSQRELLREEPDRVRDSSYDTDHILLNEVVVNVHRNGELAKSGNGNHRLSIAKLLGIDEIPVLVRVRHADWQAIRNEIRRAESPDELSRRARNNLSHPDLTDIVPDDWARATGIESTEGGFTDDYEQPP
ncbi:hypothetical protein [Halorussus salinisoli]|uniref:hypothetical protein n=1 Tax=Halorussus salinisoli TaxID=2558242 RepID=UPI0010C22AC3|nr:hypothetical protein [Halorussus salinisoli]